MPVPALQCFQISLGDISVRSVDVSHFETLLLPHGNGNKHQMAVAPNKDVVISVDKVCDWRSADASWITDAYCLEHKQEYPTNALQLRNATPRCHRITFQEDTHTYLVDGQVVPWSVSQFVHMQATPFDADEVLSRYYSASWALARNYSDGDGNPMTPDEIKQKWKQDGQCQARRGTLLHWHIECHLNGYHIAEPLSPDFLLYLQFEAAFMKPFHLTPWRTEMNMFHCGLRLAGQADLICQTVTGSLVILDWKRCKTLNINGFCGLMQLHPLDHVPDCNMWHYCLQLNAYKAILEQEYFTEQCVIAMFLVVLHPEQSPRQPHVYLVPDMAAEINQLATLAQSIAKCSAEPKPGADAMFDMTNVSFTVLSGNKQGRS